ncbi:hypothetical protein VTL71DRAFT_5980 [Oculimacula yallundae]|uniref:Uncharacterized protein n=1 Tax=Oculimacula yallundae TaxID=86028 RepID=A0ABR4BZ37_9HELO
MSLPLKLILTFTTAFTRHEICFQASIERDEGGALLYTERPRPFGSRTTGANILEFDFLVAAAKAFEDGTLDILINSAGRLQTMAMGPFLTRQHLLPSVKMGSTSKIIDISSYLPPDIKKEDEGNFLAHRMARAAFNQQIITISNELRNADFHLGHFAQSWLCRYLTDGWRI